MAIELATQYLGYVDELFATESKKSILSNQDFDWTGAHTIKIYSISTANMTDYDRAGTGTNPSRYGPLQGLNATTQEMTLRRDRSFTFAIDRLDTDETKQTLQSASALARQVREVIIPEVDSWCFHEIIANAGQTPAAISLTPTNIYAEIVAATNALDNEEVPETDRVIAVTPNVYALLKQCKNVMMETDISNEMRLRGVVAMIDGAKVVKVPANRLPANFGFLMLHPIASVTPVKLEDYVIHDNPPGINGALVEGRINYDAFVLNNKVNAIYYQELI